VTVRVALVSHQHTIMKNFQETLGQGCRTSACWEKKMFGDKHPSLGNLGMVCDKGIHLNNDKLGLNEEIHMPMFRKYDPEGDNVNVVSPGTEAPQLFECAANRCFRPEGEMREVIPGLCEYDERTNKLMEWLKEQTATAAESSNATDAPASSSNATDAPASSSNATDAPASSSNVTDADSDAPETADANAETAVTDEATGTEEKETADDEGEEEEEEEGEAGTALNEEHSEVRILRKPTVQRQQIL